MRLVYVDEAGLSNPAHEPYLVVAAVMLDADKQLVALERKIQALIDHWIPAERRDGFVFHATELFNGGGKVFKRNDPDWPQEKRLKIAEQLAMIPQRLGLKIAFGFVPRREFPRSFEVEHWKPGDITIMAHVVAYVSCAIQVDVWLRNNAPSEVALMIVEDNQQAKSIITTMQNEYQKPSSAEGVDPRLASFLPLRKIKASPLFERKDQSIALQMADFCAYVMKKRMMGNPYYNRFFDPLVPLFVQVEPRQMEALDKVFGPAGDTT